MTEDGNLVRRTARITSPYGVHAVLPRHIIETAREVDAKCWVRIDGETAEADRWVQLVAGLPWGNSQRAEIEPVQIEAIAQGPDAEEFVESVADFVENHLLALDRRPVGALRGLLTGDEYGDGLEGVLREILDTNRISEQNRRRLRHYRDQVREQFGLLTRAFRLNEVDAPAHDVTWDGDVPWETRGHDPEGSDTPDKAVPPPEERDLPGVSPRGS